jgi:spermidine synthase
MQAHLPLLLHPSPRRVAFLGLGTGITAGGALFHPVEHVTVMELVPEVVTASRAYFRTANAGVLDDLRTRVIEDDARNYLRGSGEQFDVIIGDLVVPWRQGEGSLFTLEQFTAAHRALAPGGIFCQWLPLFQLSATEVTILVRTFLEVFPHAEIWRGDFSPTEPAIALIGSDAEIAAVHDNVGRRLREMRLDNANSELSSPEFFWMHRVGVIEAADLPSGEKRINREDQPWIELLGPMLHSGGKQEMLFTGRRLQEWLDKIRLRSRERVRSSNADTAVAQAAGASFAEVILRLAEGNSAGANAEREHLRTLLPDAVFRQLFR